MNDMAGVPDIEADGRLGRRFPPVRWTRGGHFSVVRRWTACVIEDACEEHPDFDAHHMEERESLMALLVLFGHRLVVSAMVALSRDYGAGLEGWEVEARVVAYQLLLPFFELKGIHDEEGRMRTLHLLLDFYPFDVESGLCFTVERRPYSA